MPIEFPCPQCSELVRVPEERAGRAARCPGCQTLSRVPGASADQPDAEPPEPGPVAAGPGAKMVGAPRRRVRREKPSARPLWRKIALWVGALLGTIAVLFGIGYAMLPGANWHRHESAAGGFAIDAPCRMRPNFRLPGTEPIPNQTTEGNRLLKHGLLFAVVRREIDALPRRDTDEGLLQTVADDLRKDPEVKTVVREERVTVSGFPGSELEYVSADGDTTVARVVVAHTRLYFVLVGGWFAGQRDERARRFLDSFEITDDTLVGGTAHKRKTDEATARAVAGREAANATFRAAKYAGPKPCDPLRLLGPEDAVLYLPMDDRTADGVGDFVRLGHKGGGTVVRNASVGPGVLGEGAYIGSSAQAHNIELGDHFKAIWARQTVTGHSVAMWYKVRNKGLSGIALRTWGESAVVNVCERTIEARYSGTKGFVLELPRPEDENWHHVALTHVLKGGRLRATLYVDGASTSAEREQPFRFERMYFGCCHPAASKPWLVPGLDPHPEIEHAAVDEVCLFNFPLSAEQVGALAGRNPVPKW